MREHGLHGARRVIFVANAAVSSGWQVAVHVPRV